MPEVGTVITVDGNNVTVQLSNNRIVTFSMEPNLKLAVGDHAGENIVRAAETLVPELIARGVTSIVLQ